MVRVVEKSTNSTFLWFNCDGVLGGTLIALGFLLFCLAGHLYLCDISPVPELVDLCRMADTQTTKRDKFREAQKTAFILGYTGETGKVLTQMLAEEKLFEKVTLIGRRLVELPNVGPEFKQKIVDFEDLQYYEDEFKGHDVGFCCIGTTRAKSGEKGFRRVDYDYVLTAAELAKAGGTKHFQFMSTYGANPNSSQLYTEVKGKVEEALKVMHFERLSIFRPAVLLVDREEKRPMEAVARFVLKPVAKIFPTAITIPIDLVAKAFINNVVSPTTSTVEVFENKAIHVLSGDTPHCGSKDEL